MRRRYKGRQTARRGRRYNIRWGKLLLFLVIISALGFVIWLAVKLLSGDIKGLDPAASPTPPVSVIGPTPLPTPVPELSEDLSLSPVPGTDPSDFGFETDIMVNREIVDSFTRPQPIRFKKGEEYTDIAGIITFGGSNYRDRFTYGTQSVVNKTLSRVWEIELGSLEGWTGAGWTGMPVIVQWPDEVRKVLGVFDEFKDMDGFTEVIYPVMDGYVYFAELYSGKKTRNPIHLGVTTKGTASLDPRGYPLLYTGQGLESTEADGSKGAWFRVIDLIENKVIWKFGGKDPFSFRGWQAYDSSALVDAATDTLIAPGENGVLYTAKLNARFDPEAGTVSVDPGPLEKYRYKGEGYGFNEESDKRWVGIENSVAVWRNYAYFTDSGGRLQCLDLNTFELQYVVDVTDDSDSSIVIEEDIPNDTFYLYTANEVDKQPGISNGVGKCYHRKINGLTGEIVWEKGYDASIGNTSSNGGTLTTPHVGRGNISDLVIYNQTLVPVSIKDENGGTKQVYGGRIVCYNKETGNEVWRYEQKDNYWSSPVVIYDENDNAYLIQCDRGGMMRMHDARTGSVLSEVYMGSDIDATPSVFNNMIVVGTRGGNDEHQKIIGVRIG
ncbi:MAG: PQQ enzyme repeat protein [Firmicutes bacterium ADurb.Bin182]|nr:MAG: PQQ enzyme repeat protein [Firmicutes bacterium ADurb.Bin182]